jgi:hypothetical protein
MILGLVIIMLVGLSTFVILKNPGRNEAPANSTEQVTTTTDNDSTAVTTSLNQPLIYNNVMVTATKVLEDSRCPSDVQCIQAGTVRLSLNIETTLGTSTVEMRPGETVKLDGFSLSFDSVSPYPVSTSKISPADYKFILGIL